MIKADFPRDKFYKSKLYWFRLREEELAGIWSSIFLRKCTALIKQLKLPQYSGWSSFTSSYGLFWIWSKDCTLSTTCYQHDYNQTMTRYLAIRIGICISWVYISVSSLLLYAFAQGVSQMTWRNIWWYLPIHALMGYTISFPYINGLELRCDFHLHRDTSDKKTRYIYYTLSQLSG